MDNLICNKCLCSRTGDVLGQPCRTRGCEGIIERQPEFAELVETLDEPMTCGRRADTYGDGVGVHGEPQNNQDHWERFKSNGNRVCSWCGSLHWEDMLSLVKQAADAPEDAAYSTVPEIEPSEKSYKIYVHQPGVRNAMEGGIKFYTQHIPRDENGKFVVTKEQKAEYAKAVLASKERFRRSLYGK